MLRRFIFILILAIHIPALAKKDNIIRDVATLDSLCKIADTCKTIEVLHYSNLIFNSAKALNNKRYIYKSISYTTDYYYDQYNPEAFEAYIDSIQQTYDLKKEAPYTYGRNLYNLSRLYSLLNRFESSIKMAMILYAESETPKDYEMEYCEELDRLIVPIRVNNRLNALSSLGWTYYYMDEYEKALKYMSECVDIIKQYPQKELMARDLLQNEYGLMMASYDNPNTDLILRNIQNLENDVKIYGHQTNMYPVYLQGIEDEYVDLYCRIDQLDKAKYHYKRLSNMMDTCKAVQEYRDNFHRLSAVYYLKLNKGDKALMHADSAMILYHEQDLIELETEALLLKIKAAHMANKDSLVYDMANKMFKQTQDIYDDRYNSAVENMSATLGRDRLNIDAERAKTERGNMLILTVVILLSAATVVILVKRQHEKEHRDDLKKQKAFLEKEVKRQTDVISIKNDRITSSIRYAQNIQNAMLPNINTFGHGLIEGAFAIYKPCKIVSGDFYWAKQTEKELLIVTADSDEQGVYGAFFSMIGATMLNEICSKDITISPNKILSELGKRLSSTLSQTGGKAVNYRMNASVVYLNIEKMTMKLSIANNCILLYRNGKFTVWENSNDSIGEINSESVYITRELSIQKGDVIYLGSNGLSNQQGGTNGEPLGIDQLQNMLGNIAPADIYKQEDLLRREIEWWQGNMPQGDDITAIGIKI